jgi:hypothetical protein
VGTCDIDNLVLQPAPAPGSIYFCTFAQDIPPGNPGDLIEDIVTATGVDDEGDPAVGLDNAIVGYLDDAVIPAPKIEVAKFASPFEIPEPGSDVTFSVVVTNASNPNAVNRNLTLAVLEDNIYGDLFTRGDCGLLQDLVLVPEQTASCSFTEAVVGVSGDIHTNTITVTAIDERNSPIQDSASASVTVTDLPASLQVRKRANPTTVVEPGDDVTFDVLVVNASQADIITLESLVDDVHGDLVAQGLCPPPGALFPGRDPYYCLFTTFVAGPAGFVENNTVTAAGADNNGNKVQASSQASVTVIAERPSIEAVKTAQPNILRNSEEPVTFTFTVANTSRVARVILENFEDSSFGDLNGQGDCKAPQELDAGDSYTCSIEVFLTGINGDVHVNQFVVNGKSEDGKPVAASDVAAVVFAAYDEIPALGRWGLAVMILLLGWLGLTRIRGSG